MPKISEKIAFHLSTGASMLRRGAIALPSSPLAPPLAMNIGEPRIESSCISLYFKILYGGDPSVKMLAFKGPPIQNTVLTTITEC